jgi:hypothetical protein
VSTEYRVQSIFNLDFGGVMPFGLRVVDRRWDGVVMRGDGWRCVAIRVAMCGDVWRCVWRLVATCGDLWRLVATCGDLWRCIAMLLGPATRIRITINSEFSGTIAGKLKHDKGH